MIEKEAALSSSFENKIMNLVKGRASGFRGSRALAEGLMGGALGTGAGVLSEAKKEYEGQFQGMSPEEKLNHYLGGAARYGAIGAGIGGLKGGVSGGKMLETAARKHLGEMTPFLEEQLAKGVGERTLLKKLKEMSPVNAKDYLIDAKQKGLADTVQEMFAGVQPTPKKPVHFGDIVAGTKQEEALAARKLEETSLRKQQEELVRAEKERARKGTLSGESMRVKNLLGKAQAEAVRDIHNPEKLNALMKSQAQNQALRQAESHMEKYMSTKDTDPVAAMEHLKNYKESLALANLKKPTTVMDLLRKGKNLTEEAYTKTKDTAQNIGSKIKNWSQEQAIKGEMLSSSEVADLGQRKEKLLEEIANTREMFKTGPSQELAAKHRALNEEVKNIERELSAHEELARASVKNPESVGEKIDTLGTLAGKRQAEKINKRKEAINKATQGQIDRKMKEYRKAFEDYQASGGDPVRKQKLDSIKSEIEDLQDRASAAIGKLTGESEKPETLFSRLQRKMAPTQTAPTVNENIAADMDKIKEQMRVAAINGDKSTYKTLETRLGDLRKLLSGAGKKRQAER